MQKLNFMTQNWILHIHFLGPDNVLTVQNIILTLLDLIAEQLNKVKRPIWTFNEFQINTTWSLYLTTKELHIRFSLLI